MNFLQGREQGLVACILLELSGRCNDLLAKVLFIQPK